MTAKYLPVSRREVRDDITLSVAVCVLGGFCICDVSVIVQSVLNIHLFQRESQILDPHCHFCVFPGVICPNSFLFDLYGSFC